MLEQATDYYNVVVQQEYWFLLTLNHQYTLYQELKYRFEFFKALVLSGLGYVQIFGSKLPKLINNS